MPIETDTSSHDRPILLLSIRIIVLLPGSAAGEDDQFLQAVTIPLVVDKLGAVIGLERAPPKIHSITFKMVYQQFGEQVGAS